MMEVSAEIKAMARQMTDDLFMFGKARMDGKPLSDLKPDTAFSVIPLEDAPLSFPKSQTALKSFDQWQKEKRECENEEDWEKIKEGIENATNLTSKQKTLLTKYS